MVTCSVCRSECRHWITEKPSAKHVSCPKCKEHWIYEFSPDAGKLVGRLDPQILMFG